MVINIATKSRSGELKALHAGPGAQSHDAVMGAGRAVARGIKNFRRERGHLVDPDHARHLAAVAVRHLRECDLKELLSRLGRRMRVGPAAAPVSSRALSLSP